MTASDEINKLQRMLSELAATCTQMRQRMLQLEQRVQSLEEVHGQWPTYGDHDEDSNCDRKRQPRWRRILDMDDGMDDFEEETRRAIESFLIQNGAKRIISFGSGITKYGRDGRVEMSCGPAIMDDRRIIVIHYAKRLKNANVDWHIEQLMRFRQFFPEHAGKALHGAVGGMVVPEEVQRYAEQQGLYVLTQVDGVVMIKNQPDFVAKTW